MAQLLLKDWKPGLKKISAVKLLQERGGLSLTVAKECVDRLLKHKEVTIAIPTAEEAIELAGELRSLNVICEVTSDESEPLV